MNKSSVLLKCWNCGEPLNDITLPISRHATCASCFEVLRCCRMCSHYRELDHIKCAEDRADAPVIKENANFCEFLKPASDAFKPKSSDSVTATKSQLDALFGGDAERNEEHDEEHEREHEREGDKISSDGLALESSKRNSLDDLFND